MNVASFDAVGTYKNSRTHGGISGSFGAANSSGKASGGSSGSSSGGSGSTAAANVSTTVQNQTSSSTSSAVGPVDANTQAQRAKYNGDYVESARVTSAYNYLQNVLNNKPGEFKSSFETQLNELYDKIINRDPFSYNVNEDMLYQQYRDQYMRQGKTAMEDTTAQAAAMTGGYGSSYSEVAGQQAYQGYLQQLNDKVPELYQMAYDRYRDDTEELYNQYGITKGRYDTEYGEYRDKVEDWKDDRSFGLQNYTSERDFDWNQFSANRQYWSDEYWRQKNAVQQTINNLLSTTTTTR